MQAHVAPSMRQTLRLAALDRRAGEVQSVDRPLAADVIQDVRDLRPGPAAEHQHPVAARQPHLGDGTAAETFRHPNPPLERFHARSKFIVALSNKGWIIADERSVGHSLTPYATTVTARFGGENAAYKNFSQSLQKRGRHAVASA